VFFHIDPHNGLAIYDQIVRQVKFAVAGGVLKSGELVPSVRELARELAINPNTIAKQEIVFRVPLNLEANSTGGETSLGPIGIATNGVVLYNEYAGRTVSGDWSPLDDEIDTFDRFNGHPDQKDQYHYHMEPLFLTEADKSSLVGVIMDGFPDRPAQQTIGDYPSRYHNNAGGFRFADGHCEIHKWLDPRTMKNYRKDVHLAVFRDPSPDNRDVRWLQERVPGL
jgi:hypothetical protein